jgi:hypothetical protein
MWLFIYMEQNYQTTSISHRFLLSNFEKYCTTFKPLFMHGWINLFLPFPIFDLYCVFCILREVGEERKVSK